MLYVLEFWHYILNCCPVFGDHYSFKVGADGYIVKPFEPETIVQNVEKFL